MAGKIALFYDNWINITSDKFILDIVKHGYQIEFESPPCEQCNRAPLVFNPAEDKIISKLLQKFLDKGVIEESFPEGDEVISHIFIRPKADGSHRLILNLSKLNEHVEKVSFKMETLKTAIHLVEKNCFFAKIDLKDAFYSISVNQHFRKFLKFYWKGKLYSFTCLANGLSSASRIFTKVLKPVFASLRKMGNTNVAYIDDSLLKSLTYEACKQNVIDTLTLVDSLGLTVHPEKSILEPTQCIEFVGFLLNSVNMTIRLAERKCLDIKKQANKLIYTQYVSIREFSKMIGKLVAAEPGVRYAALYYKSLEIDRDLALKKNAGNFDAIMCISPDSKACLKWWIENIDSAFRPISYGKPDRKIESDSSMTGYGGHDLTNNTQFSGTWNLHEKTFHINYLELKAAFLSLKHFCGETKNEHVQLFLDNTVAIKYLTKMGGRKSRLNTLAREIWCWREKRNIWLAVFHIAGSLNVRADALSRAGKKLNDDMEWALDQNVFNCIQKRMGQCFIDLFASSKNNKLNKYVSYVPDKGAFAINAFSLSWNNGLQMFAFPPFSVIGHLLQKLTEDTAEIILVAPIFPTQPWFPHLLQQISGQCYILPKIEQILHHPTKNIKHRLTKMRMGVFKLSGNALSVQAYQNKLVPLSCSPGGNPLPNSMGHISKDGCNFVHNNRWIKLIHL